MIRNPVPWPDGAKCAVSITFDMDADSLVHMARPQRSPDMVAATSMLRYGPEVAIPRILESWRRLEITQTFFIPAWCAETHPRAVEQIAEAGHEIALHSYIHEFSHDKPREEESYWLRRARESLTRIAGKAPRGWRAPMYSFSRHSADLLIDEGFLYDASLMGEDIPYMLEAEKGRLVEVPAHWGADDYPQYAHTPELDYSMPVKAPRAGIENYQDEFEAHHAHGGMFVGVWHPFLTGRLTRWHHIEKMLLEWREKGDVWFASMENIAQHAIACEKAGTFRPRVSRVPFYTEPLSLLRAEPK